MDAGKGDRLYSLVGNLFKRFCNMFSESYPCAAWQLQNSPMACGTLRKHFTAPLEQAAASDCIPSQIDMYVFGERPNAKIV